MTEMRRRRGRPPKDLLPVPAPEETHPPMRKPEPPKPTGVQDGDIFKHYIEHDCYCVLITDDENIKYATLINTVSWGKFKELKHEDMIRSALVMTKANADAIIKKGKWIHVGNIVKSWGG